MARKTVHDEGEWSPSPARQRSREAHERVQRLVNNLSRRPHNLRGLFTNARTGRLTGVVIQSHARPGSRTLLVRRLNPELVTKLYAATNSHARAKRAWVESLHLIDWEDIDG